MSADYSVGIDVGGTKIAFGLFDKNRKLIGKRTILTRQDQTPDIFFNNLATEAQILCEENVVDVKTLAGIGVGMPGFIRRQDGYVFKNTNIPSLHGCMAKEFISEAFGGIRVELDNDTHVAALAESRQGAGSGVDNMLYCAVSSGIASAPIIDGNLFRGTYGFSGESGHMIITPDQGLLCECGKRGCFMSWCSGIMIAKHVQNWIQDGEPTVMTEFVDDVGEITTKEIAKAWRMDDPLATRAVKQMQRFFALWFYNLYLFTNISFFVLGGGLLKMGDDFWETIVSEFNALSCDTSSECPVSIMPALLGEDFGIIGANELLY